MKQKYLDLAKKIVDEKTVFSERAALEDELVEMAYKITNEFEITPEEIETARDVKRAKNGLLNSEGDFKKWLRDELEKESKKLLKSTSKSEVAESVGDILEIVETYTARF